MIENGVAIGSLGAGEAVWHTDMSYLVDPPKASVLYALEVPPSGGETGFCSMYRAWEALPEGLQRRVADLRVKHDGTYNSGGYVRAGVTPTDDPRSAPGTLHALVGPIRKPDAGSCISGAGGMRISKACLSRSPRRCWTRSGPTPPPMR